MYDDLSTLKGRKDNGYRVGERTWKGPQGYRSITYSQTGFELNNTSGRTRLSLSKIGDIPTVCHRDVPDDATIKEVIVKQEPTGEWFAVLGTETEDDTPLKPENPGRCVEIRGRRSCRHHERVCQVRRRNRQAALGPRTLVPFCGFEADRDANAAYNILSRGLTDGGVVHPEPTPAETALTVDTVVSAKRVVETGSPALSEASEALCASDRSSG